MATTGASTHDVTKIQIYKISILPGFYFHDALEQLKTDEHNIKTITDLYNIIYNTGYKPTDIWSNQSTEAVP